MGLEEESIAGRRRELGGERVEERTTVRLTIRMPAELDSIMRAESDRLGMNLNQMMLMMLSKEIYHSDKMIGPCSFS